MNFWMHEIFNHPSILRPAINGMTFIHFQQIKKASSFTYDKKG